MSWQKYDLIFRLQSPMHIGWRKSGNLMQTRGYVTGKVFWAALTARLTRDYDNGAANAARYGEIGEQIKENFRFSYLYPAIHDGAEYKFHYPWEDDFDYLFLNSYASTSINYSNQSAEDSMLHETEFISPYTRPYTRDGKPVYLRGSIYACSSLPESLKKWKDTLNTLQFGGERTYGWGKVNCINDCKADKDYNGEEPKICLKKGCKIKAHLQVKNITGIVGCIEPLTGWERNNKPYDNSNGKTEWALSKALICYEPGSIVSTEEIVCTIGPYGIWEK
jgi:hypothetical protein